VPSATLSGESAPFELVAGDARSEVGPTLAAPVPRALGVIDQIGLWGNLGVSLLGFAGAIFVLQPGGAGTARLSIVAAICAIVAGTVLGTVPIALAGLPGTKTAISAGATLCALVFNISTYENFLVLLGSVFVPLSAVLIVDFRLVGATRWDLSTRSRTRWSMLLAWAVGFVVYQLINPGYIRWWATLGGHIAHAFGFTPSGWMSASILSFVAAAIVTAACDLAARARRRG
jgi:purine-cytosine permease-like protein